MQLCEWSDAVHPHASLLPRLQAIARKVPKRETPPRTFQVTPSVNPFIPKRPSRMTTSGLRLCEKEDSKTELVKKPIAFEILAQASIHADVIRDVRLSSPKKFGQPPANMAQSLQSYHCSPSFQQIGTGYLAPVEGFLSRLTYICRQFYPDWSQSHSS